MLPETHEHPTSNIFNLVLRPFQDYISSHEMGKAVGGVIRLGKAVLTCTHNLCFEQN